MGCTGSSGFNPNVTYPGQTEQLIVIASELGMEKRDLNNLFKSYAKYDAVRIKLGGNNQAGEINMKDFFLLNQITSDDFAQHMSDTLFFNNKTGMVNFEGNMNSVWFLYLSSLIYMCFRAFIHVPSSFVCVTHVLVLFPCYRVCDNRMALGYDFREEISSFRLQNV